MRAKAVFLADGAFHVDVVVDVDHLPPGVVPPESAGGLDAFGDQIARGVRAAFDGVPARLEEASLTLARMDEILGGSAAGGKLVFRLEGRVPGGAKSFSWSHSLPIGTYLFGIEEPGAEVAWHWLEGGGEPYTHAFRNPAPAPARAEVMRQYLELGFTHILPKGLDHILFVLGLFLLSLEPMTILKQVTAFTIAHSITLGLTIYGVVSLSPAIVEPLIALSIVYVAVENLMVTRVKPWRIVVVACFGLLHGMGFAGVLSELGLPRSEFVTALVSFNVGVEVGQLAVIAMAYLAVGLWSGTKPWYRQRVTIPASALIALVGLYWTVQRVLF
jgi:hypothetical protein